MQITDIALFRVHGRYDGPIFPPGERQARAVDLYATGSVQGAGSAWSLDPSVGAALRGGVELGDIVGLEAQTRLGYSRVDERMLAAVSVGARVTQLPSGRMPTISECACWLLCRTSVLR